MNNKNKESIICYIYLFMMSVVTFLENFEILPNYFINLIKISCLCLAIICLWNKKVTRKQMTNLILITIFLVIIYISSGLQFLYLITNIVTIYVIKDIPIKKVVQPMLVARSLMFMLLILGLCLGYIENNYMYRINSDIKRYCLGFVHPNTAYWNYFSLIAMYIYYQYDKFGIKSTIIILISSCMMYALTDSRTGFLCTILYLVFILIAKNMKRLRENAIIKKISIYSFPIFALFSIIPSYLYSKVNIPIVTKLNNFMSDRIYLGSLLYERYNMELLGQKVALYDGNLRLTIDNGYVYMSVAFGVIFMVVFSILYVKLFKEMYKRKMYVEIAALMIFNIYTLSEKLFLNIFTNFTIVFFVYILYNNIEKESEMTENIIEEKNKLLFKI